MSDLRVLSEIFTSGDLTQTKLADETGVILDVETLQVFSLNETAAFLIEAIRSGVSTRDELIQLMVDEFDTDPETAGNDLDQFTESASQHLLRDRDSSQGA